MPAALRGAAGGRARWCCWRTIPTLFPEAAAHGVELTLSGHTHGGQVAVPGCRARLNLARLITPFTAGSITRGDPRCT